MNISRWALYNRLKEIYPNVKLTYGYIAKTIRHDNEIEKSHINDALCIAGHPKATQSSDGYLIKKNRVHNRQIHKANILKGGRLKLNQAPHLVKGYRLNDIVLYNGQIYTITGRRSSGFFQLKNYKTGEKLPSVSYKRLKLLEKAKYYTTERIARS